MFARPLIHDALSPLAGALKHAARASIHLSPSDSRVRSKESLESSHNGCRRPHSRSLTLLALPLSVSLSSRRDVLRHRLYSLLLLFFYSPAFTRTWSFFFAHSPILVLRPSFFLCFRFFFCVRSSVEGYALENIALIKQAEDRGLIQTETSFTVYEHNVSFRFVFQVFCPFLDFLEG